MLLANPTAGGPAVSPSVESSSADLIAGPALQEAPAVAPSVGRLCLDHCADSAALWCCPTAHACPQNCPTAGVPTVAKCGAP